MAPGTRERGAELRIALLPSAYSPAIGGVEELTRQLGLHLTKAGHQVEVWTNRHPDDLPSVEVIDGLKVRRIPMPLPGASVAGLTAFTRGALRASRDLGRAVRSFQPDRFHVHCFSAQGVYAAAISRLTGIPLIITLHGETFMDDSDVYEHSTSLRLGLRAGLRQAAAVSGCSAFVVQDAVRRFGLAPGRGAVIPNGVELPPGQTPAAMVSGLELPFERFILGLGRVVYKKGFDLLLGAFAQVSGRHPAVGLVIGGQGDALADLRAQAERLGLGDRVHFTGALDRDQVARAMRDAEMLVVPSRIEPFGIVTLEALAAGCPVIVSSRGGGSEIVRDGTDGLVVDPLDRSALMGAIEQLLDDPARRQRLAAAGRERAERYAWPRVIGEYLKLYELATSRS